MMMMIIETEKNKHGVWMVIFFFGLIETLKIKCLMMKEVEEERKRQRAEINHFDI